MEAHCVQYGKPPLGESTKMASQIRVDCNNTGLQGESGHPGLRKSARAVTGYGREWLPQQAPLQRPMNLVRDRSGPRCCLGIYRCTSGPMLKAVSYLGQSFFIRDHYSLHVAHNP